MKRFKVHGSSGCVSERSRLLRVFETDRPVREANLFGNLHILPFCHQHLGSGGIARLGIYYTNICMFSSGFISRILLLSGVLMLTRTEAWGELSQSRT